MYTHQDTTCRKIALPQLHCSLIIYLRAHHYIYFWTLFTHILSKMIYFSNPVAIHQKATEQKMSYKKSSH